jgi:4-hydroxy-tetrahydrodipicolinate synthase
VTTCDAGAMRRSFRERIHGKLLPAVPVPMTADYAIHRKAQDAYVRYMSSHQVGGVAVWAHTGRGLHLERDTRMEIMKSWRDGFSDGRLVIAGVGALPDATLPEDKRLSKFQDDTVRMAEDALEAGADAFLVYAPVIYRDRPDQDELVADYHRRLAQYGVPLVLFYLYRGAGGISYSHTLLDALMSIPQACAIKLATLDSVTTYQDVARVINEKHPDISLITGEDRMVGYTLMRGGVSALIGMGSACTKPQVDLLNHWFSGNAAAFLDLSSKVDDFSEVTFAKPMDWYIIRQLWCLVLEGVIPEDAAHDVLGRTISRDEVRLLEATMKRLGWL